MSVDAIDRGTGAPVVLLHGNPDSKEIWLPVIERLAPTRRCFAPDLPGFGGSEVPADHDFGLSSQARWVEAAVSAAGIDEPVTLVVHDVGGPYGLAWAVEHRARVARLVITNTIFTPRYRWHPWARVWRTPLVGELSMLLMNRPLFAREIRKNRPKISDEEVRAAYARITPRSKRGVLAWYRAMDVSCFEGWHERLRALVREIPTRVRWGDTDPYIDKSFADSFDAADTIHYAEEGHWLLADRPEIIADAVLG